MTAVFIFIHTLCAVLLITAILMQSGRGGGLTDSFASAESIFGAKTNAFMVRTTVTLASVFLVTSLVLAYLSAKREESLIADTVVAQEEVLPDQADSLPDPVPEGETTE